MGMAGGVLGVGGVMTVEEVIRLFFGLFCGLSFLVAPELPSSVVDVSCLGSLTCFWRFRLVGLVATSSCTVACALLMWSLTEGIVSRVARFDK